MLAHAILVIIAAMCTLSVFATIGTTGKPRKPITPGLAAAVAWVQLMYVVGLLYVYGQL